MSESQWNIAPPDRFGCTLWRGQLDKDGYPIVWRGRGQPPVRAHREIYKRRHGSIAPGKEVEHRCRRRACMTDAHHLLVDRSTNMRLIRWRHRVKAAICAAGHDPWLDVMVTPEGGRVCRVCSTARAGPGSPAAASSRGPGT